MNHYATTRNLLRTFTVVVALASALSPATGRGESAAWPEPTLDTWVYPNAFTAGTRTFAPSFGFIDYDPATEALAPTTTSRLGYKVFAFETTDSIDAGLDPRRYAIQSVTVTAKAERGQGGPLTYTASPLTVESATTRAAAGEFGARLPMELYGVGFAGGFDGFALGVDRSGLRYTEASPVWSGGDYLLYPTDATTGGDVVNSLGGGFSASEPSGETAPFTPTPFAIGTVPGAAEGDALPNDTTFHFEFDLSTPGVLAYLRESLSRGVVGFTLSSLHSGAQPGTSGGSPYPQWYTKEAVQFFENAEGASLSIDFAILPEPGDYDGDGSVDALDLAAWREAYGGDVGVAGTGADGNGDGVVDAADYVAWRNASRPQASVAVPEAGSGVLALIGVATVTFCVGTCVYTTPRKPRK